MFCLAHVVRKIAFHKKGHPRGWLRLILLRDKRGTPRVVSRRLLLKNNGEVRPCFRMWYSKYRISPELRIATDYVYFLTEQVRKHALNVAQSLHVVTTPHTEFIRDLIVAALRQTRFIVTSSVRMPAEFNHDLYIVVAPQMFSKLPPTYKTIVFQMEQVRASSWVTERYLEVLSSCLAVMDYSLSNICALTERGLSPKQMYYVPIRPVAMIEERSLHRDIDVLFYGSTASSRRMVYIDALKAQFQVRVESNLFGNDLIELLKRTKVVVNIHFYENALLETTRVSEALSYGARVVSEESVDQTQRVEFHNLVSFVPAGDLGALLVKVKETLDQWNQEAPELPSVDDFGTSYHIYRTLNGCGIFSFDELLEKCGQICLPKRRIVLALPEQADRYEFANNNKLAESWIFHGLRDVDGWKGCARSYKLLAILALRQGLRSLMIYEDDAEFYPDVRDRLYVVEKYLDLNMGKWDLFSGLLSDLADSARVTDVDLYEGEEFVYLDSVIGMVFSIYNRSGLELLSSFEFLGNDTRKNTIDRYLESLSPRCITTSRPIAGHSEHLVSTLWPGDNSAYVTRISRSIDRLNSKKLEYIRRSTSQ